MRATYPSALVGAVLSTLVPIVYAQTSGSVGATTHVSSTIGSVVNREVPLFVARGPISLTDAIVASVPGAPPDHAYAQAAAFADWMPGAVKVAATAGIDGVCIPNGGGGCEGPGTTQAGAKANASTLTFTDPGISSDTMVQNNLVLSGSILRAASFISPPTEDAYKNGTVPDATASFSFSVMQARFNQDAGRDVFVRVAGGGIQIVSHYDGTVDLITNGFLQSNPSWNNSPIALTTPSYQLVAGKQIEVEFSAQVDSSFLYSLRAADQIVSSLVFANTFGFSSGTSSPAFVSGTPVNIPELGIQGGVYAPVPEPSSWLFVAFGFGVMVVSRYRLARGPV